MFLKWIVIIMNNDKPFSVKNDLKMIIWIQLCFLNSFLQI